MPVLGIKEDQVHIRVCTGRSMTGSYTALCVPLACAAVILAELGIDKLLLVDGAWYPMNEEAQFGDSVDPYPSLISW